MKTNTIVNHFLVLIQGITLGGMLIGLTFHHYDGVKPYLCDATKIDLVKKGLAKWETLPNGKTKWKLIIPPQD